MVIEFRFMVSPQEYFNSQRCRTQSWPCFSSSLNVQKSPRLKTLRCLPPVLNSGVWISVATPSRRWPTSCRTSQSCFPQSRTSNCDVPLGGGSGGVCVCGRRQNACCKPLKEQEYLYSQQNLQITCILKNKISN